jgi:hypothetical protein
MISPSTSPVETGHGSALRWRIAVLVGAAIAISYLDRQTLPWALSEISKDIPVSNQVKAFLDSAFLVTYGLMYLGGGGCSTCSARAGASRPSCCSGRSPAPATRSPETTAWGPCSGSALAW